MSNIILIINAGSSSIKFTVFAVDESDLKLVFKGQIDGIGTQPRFKVRNAQGLTLTDERWEPLPEDQGHAKAFVTLSQWLQQNIHGSRLIAVGHRVVHGGPSMTAPVRINDTMLATLDSLVPLMPLHLPHNLRAIKAIRDVRPDIEQVACFDTAFHHGHPRSADMYGLPHQLHKEGVRRYGFHGLSFEYITHRLDQISPELSGGRVVIAHLGNGASMCAVHNRQSIDATMGFSALDGLPMGTRCGSIDPGVLLYLLGEKGLNLQQLETLLYKQSGLRGLSGISNDLRQLLESPDPNAREAIDYLVYRINRELGSLTAALGGLDGLIFTAGIGENSPEIRKQVCEKAAWLGIKLDHDANQKGQLRISPTGSWPQVLVIPTDEEKMIAIHTVKIVGAKSPDLSEIALHD